MQPHARVYRGHVFFNCTATWSSICSAFTQLVGYSPTQNFGYSYKKKCENLEKQPLEISRNKIAS